MRSLLEEILSACRAAYRPVADGGTDAEILVAHQRAWRTIAWFGRDLVHRLRTPRPERPTGPAFAHNGFCVHEGPRASGTR